MESDFHTSWFQCSMLVYRIILFGLSVCVIFGQIAMVGNFALRMEWSCEFKCATTGRPR